MQEESTPGAGEVTESGALELLGELRESPEELDLVELALEMARRLQERAVELQTPQERRQQAELDLMIHNPQDRVTLTQMTDRAFRSHVPERAVEQLIHILDVQGIPRFFSPMERTLLRGFQSFGGYLPGVAAPLVKDKMQKETANVILPAEPENLASHLERRCRQGLRMNVNFLGEALLGEAEARARLKGYLQALQLEETEVISVKISTIFSQISSVARRHTLAVLGDRLEMLYRAAARETFSRDDGSEVPKFIYLDMEEYRDLEITTRAFRQTLERPGLEKVRAGIALQAYIPESFHHQRELTDWARRRVEAGGAPITIRIVKGANMEMERVDASIRGWPQAPYREKIDTDANYKRMVHHGLDPENLRAVRIGVASHNLFDLAYGLVLAARREVLDLVQFEMLEGMANAQRRALFELTRNLLLYAPACKKEDFIYAIGYLIRRLDENTGPENFLRHAFKIQVGSPDWKRLEEGFLEALKLARSRPEGDPRRRDQDRRSPSRRAPEGLPAWQGFVNEPDTDFCLAHNVDWAEDILKRWKPRFEAPPEFEGTPGSGCLEIPLVIGGEEILEGREVRDSRDPSRPGAVVARYRQANSDDIERALRTAREDPDDWGELSVAEREDILLEVAGNLREARGDLIGLALAEGGKTVLESDPEISEAIDFVEFYSLSARQWYERPEVDAKPRGVVVVISPWNFPLAIPCGGVAAGLAAGNTVILKPASDTVAIAHALCECFWKAGVPRTALQFAPCAGATEGQRLVTDDRVDTVILTGGTETAVTLLEARPDLRLLAETGGKNATIVTGLADRDQAIHHVIHSAFSHSGQKCSATSLLLLEREVYEDELFRESLCDAVQSLPTGSAWDLATRVGPLIRPPKGDLERGLKELEPGESWAVLPSQDKDNPGLWSPAVKWGVKPGSFTHTTELFGPVLGVMAFDRLDEAVEIVNATGFGLTSGLESLDEREIEIWQEGIRAGNLYVNRGTTGAIVLRQPFGGLARSAFGPGIKAGGPNYVAQLLEFRDAPVASDDSSADPRRLEAIEDPALRQLVRDLLDLPDSDGISDSEVRRFWRAVESYRREQEGEFGREHDAFRLVGQDNLRRYRPVVHLRIRVHPDDTFFEIFARVAAGRTAGCRVTVSFPVDLDETHPALGLLERLTRDWGAALEFVEESDARLAEVIEQGQTDRVRFARPERVPESLRRAVIPTGIHLADSPVLADGRLELLACVYEQSLSHDYHRYGNLGDRADESRAETL